MIKETEQLSNHLSEAEDETVRLKTEEARVSSTVFWMSNKRLQTLLLKFNFESKCIAIQFKIS